MFSQDEIEFIRSQRLARIATVSRGGQPDVAPVGFQFDGKRFYVGGIQNSRTFKYKNVQAGNRRVALVVDDLASTAPWHPRGVKIHGTAELGEREGRAVLIITPARSWSWGIHAMTFDNGKPVSRKVKHTIKEG